MIQFGGSFIRIEQNVENLKFVAFKCSDSINNNIINQIMCIPYLVYVLIKEGKLEQINTRERTSHRLTVIERNRTCSLKRESFVNNKNNLEFFVYTFIKFALKNDSVLW